MRLLKDQGAHGAEVDYGTVSRCCYDYATPRRSQSSLASLHLQPPSAENLHCHAGRVLPAHRAHVDATAEGSVERRYGNPPLRISFLMTFFCDLTTLRVNTDPRPWAVDRRRDMRHRAAASFAMLGKVSNEVMRIHPVVARTAACPGPVGSTIVCPRCWTIDCRRVRFRPAVLCLRCEVLRLRSVLSIVSHS